MSLDVMSTCMDLIEVYVDCGQVLLYGLNMKGESIAVHVNGEFNFFFCLEVESVKISISSLTTRAYTIDCRKEQIKSSWFSGGV